MKAEIFWVPLLSASILCTGSRYTTRPSVADTSQSTPSHEDAGQTTPLSEDAGTAASPSEDAGTPIYFPDPDELLKGDVNLDGATFKALRVAIEDLKPRNRKPPADEMAACFDDEATYDFQIQKRGNLFFVSIVMIPERCDPTGIYVDGGVRYVISAEGQILLKRYDGQR